MRTPAEIAKCKNSLQVWLSRTLAPESDENLDWLAHAFAHDEWTDGCNEEEVRARYHFLRALGAAALLAEIERRREVEALEDEATGA
jgi:hypothetical protein